MSGCKTTIEKGSARSRCNAVGSISSDRKNSAEHRTARTSISIGSRSLRSIRMKTLFRQSVRSSGAHAPMFRSCRITIAVSLFQVLVWISSAGRPGCVSPIQAKNSGKASMWARTLSCPMPLGCVGHQDKAVGW